MNATIKKEPEYLLKNNGYPMGFIDIFLTIDYLNDNSKRTAYLIIELKQTEENLGEIIRQVNLYKNLISCKYSDPREIQAVVIFLYEPSKQTKKIFKSAEIDVLSITDLLILDHIFCGGKTREELKKSCSCQNDVK